MAHSAICYRQLRCSQEGQTTGGESKGSQVKPRLLSLHSQKLIREVDRRLRVYGNSRHFNRSNPLEELIFIILSAQTESYSYLETFKALRKRFPTKESLFRANRRSVEATIKSGGLSKKKAIQIKGVLAKVYADTGKLSLNFLSKLNDEEVDRYLTSLPGIGVKSARCVMMYSLQRPVFPVDTHVWKICRRLGLTPAVPKPTTQMEKALEARIPKELRYTLHVNMVSHGREICTTYWPKCDQCMLTDICPSAFKPDKVWGQWRKPQGFWKNYAKTAK
jgi:endonuclease III